MQQLPYLADRGAVAEATRLIASHGDVAAAAEAAQRAVRSRDIGNHVHFCRWRQIERLIRLLAQPCASGTVH